MATTLWEDFLPNLMPEFPGLSDPMAELYVRESAIDFCSRSWAWIVDHDAIDVEIGESTYNLTPPANTLVVRIMRAWYDKHVITPQSIGALSAMYGDYMQHPGRPVHYIQQVPEDLILVPQPTTDLSEGVTLKIAIKPKRSSNGIDSSIADRHFELIVSGAKVRLLNMPNRDWSDKPMGADLAERVTALIAQARVTAERGLGGAQFRAKPNFF